MPLSSCWPSRTISARPWHGVSNLANLGPGSRSSPGQVVSGIGEGAWQRAGTWTLRFLDAVADESLDQYSFLVAWAGYYAWELGDEEGARRHADRAVSIARRHDDVLGETVASTGLALYARVGGDGARAVEINADIRRMALEIDRTWLAVWADNHDGLSLLAMGEIDRAAAAAEASLRGFRGARPITGRLAGRSRSWLRWRSPGSTTRGPSNSATRPCACPAASVTAATPPGRSNCRLMQLGRLAMPRPPPGSKPAPTSSSKNEGFPPRPGEERNSSARCDAPSGRRKNQPHVSGGDATSRPQWDHSVRAHTAGNT